MLDWQDMHSSRFIFFVLFPDLFLNGEKKSLPYYMTLLIKDFLPDLRFILSHQETLSMKLTMKFSGECGLGHKADLWVSTLGVLSLVSSVILDHPINPMSLNVPNCRSTGEKTIPAMPNSQGCYEEEMPSIFVKSLFNLKPHINIREHKW